MNSKQIETFLAICDFKTFTKASEHLYTTQPVISRQLASLEYELGFQLFLRSRSNNTQITEQGEIFAAFIRKCQDEYKSMMKEVDNSLEKSSSKISLGFDADRMLSDSLDSTIRKMWAEFGFGAVSMYFNTFRSLVSSLMDGDIDLACLDDEFILPYTKDFEMRTVREARAQLLISKSHPLAEKKNLSLKDFSKDPFIVLGNWAPLKTPNIDEFFRVYLQRGHDSEADRNFLIAPDMTTMIYWCGTGIGVAPISPWHGDLDIRKCILLDIPELRIIREVLVWRRNNKSPLVEKFIQQFESIRGESNS